MTSGTTSEGVEHAEHSGGGVSPVAAAVDAIEAIAILQLERGPFEQAARLVGAAAAARDEMAYNYRYLHRAQYVQGAQVTVDIEARRRRTRVRPVALTRYSSGRRPQATNMQNA